MTLPRFDTESYTPATQTEPRWERHRFKSIQDSVHGQVQFPPAVCVVLDTPQVQRLRGLKQLGTADYVYPGAVHTRFEHSIGVAHLAMTFLNQIITNHENNPNVSDVIQFDSDEDRKRDVCCLGIAGLCHDLGHGPLSHMFEVYVNDARQKKAKGTAHEPRRWTHERASIAMLRALWREHEAHLENFSLRSCDLAFIELLINGLKPEEPFPCELVGRPSWKRFMTDIVANKRSGLDVDKLDYLMRDGVSCIGSGSALQLSRLFQGAFVLPTKDNDSGETEICYQNKLESIILDVFTARFRMHKTVYQHRIVQVVNRMLLDALSAADGKFNIEGDGGRRVSLSDAVDFPDLYLKTGDWVFSAIMHSTDSNLAEARGILQRIQRRELYESLGTLSRKVLAATGDELEAPRSDDILRRMNNPTVKGKLQAFRNAHGVEPIEVLKAKMTMSAGEMPVFGNPVASIRFLNLRWSKEYMACASTPDVSQETPMQVELCYTPVVRPLLEPAELEQLRELFTMMKGEVTKSMDGDLAQTPRRLISETPRATPTPPFGCDLSQNSTSSLTPQRGSPVVQTSMITPERPAMRKRGRSKSGDEEDIISPPHRKSHK